MSLLLNYYDDGFNFVSCKALTNPDVLELSYINDGEKLERLWRV